MKLTWTSFKGIRPKTDPRLLPDGSARVAQNINTESGGIKPVDGLRDIMALAKGSATKTIYRFGQAIDSETQFWFHWTTEVDVVKGPIANDTAERTYWTGDGVPKYTTAQQGTTGSNLPSASFPLGVSPPLTAPLLTVTGSAGTGAIAQTRVYIYTFVSTNGEESAPSSSATATVSTGQGLTVSNLATTADNGALLGTKRIYRASAGLYLFVAEIPATQTSFDDTIDSASLGEACPSIGWDLPSPTMYGLRAGPNGMMVALDGYTVRLCAPYRPHAWPMDYAQTVDYPTVGVGQYGQSFVILTTGLPVILTGTSPGNMSVANTGFYQPCLSRRSIVSTEGDVIWASPDGLVSVGSGGEQNLTKDLFTPKQWRDLAPETLIGAWHEGWYVGTFLQNNVRVGFMFSPADQAWIDLPFFTATAMYRDTVGDALFVCINGRIQAFRGGAPVAYTYESADTVTPLQDFAAARVTGDYPVMFRLFKDGRVAFQKQVVSDDPFKLPAGLARGWRIGLAGVKETLGVALATSEGEL